MWKCLLASILVFQSAIAFAEPLPEDVFATDGNFWIDSKACDETENALSDINSYLSGFFDAARVSSPDGKSFPWCLPPSTAYKARSRVVCLYLKNHPAEMHKNMAVLTKAALVEAWPCNSEGKSN